MTSPHTLSDLIKAARDSEDNNAISCLNVSVMALALFLYRDQESP